MIYKLDWEEGKVSTSRMAAKMKISQASVTEMFKKLAKSGLIVHAPYRGVELTATGERVALEVIRHHRLVELYLQESMGLSWDKVHEEADKWEHILSEELEDRIVEMLGNPTHDPHGAPIPTKDGHMPEEKYGLLCEAELGQRLVIKRVVDDDSAKLRYLADKGLFPDTEIEVTGIESFHGPVTVRIGEEEFSLGHEVTSIISVSEIGNARRAREAG